MIKRKNIGGRKFTKLIEDSYTVEKYTLEINHRHSGNLKVSPTYLPTDLLTEVGSRAAYASKMSFIQPASLNGGGGVSR